jgi:hypothetical protein
VSNHAFNIPSIQEIMIMVERLEGERKPESSEPLSSISLVRKTIGEVLHTTCDEELQGSATITQPAESLRPVGRP